MRSRPESARAAVDSSTAAPVGLSAGDVGAASGEDDLVAARGHHSGPAAAAIASLVADLRSGLAGRPAVAVLFFASGSYDPHELAGPMSAHFPEATVIGCSTAGEFTDVSWGTGGISAVALPEGILRSAVAELGDLRQDGAAGTDAAISSVEARLGVPLVDLNPRRYLGVVLIDGMHSVEEVVNERLRSAAPLLDVVGGSAGDDLAFQRTWVSVGAQISWNGVALLIAEAAVPFRVLRTSSFTPSGRTLQITKVDVPNRTVLEFDGRPAALAYAQALGLLPSEMDALVFLSHPLGQMVDGIPWIRSPQKLTPEGGMRFYSQVLEGMQVQVMNSGDLVTETAAALAWTRAELGGKASGAVMFNCILRRLEIDAGQATQGFLGGFAGIPLAGFHTYGESWLTHVNQTLTGVLFGVAGDSCHSAGPNQ